MTWLIFDELPVHYEIDFYVPYINCLDIVNTICTTD